MTFESIDEVVKLIKLNEKTPQWIIDAREYHKTLKALVYGDDFVNLLLKIEHIESSKRAIARQKYSKSIQDLNERILLLIDNIYTATGGSKEYKIKEKSQYKEFLKVITNNRGRKSIEGWLKVFWSKDLYIIDPAGVIFLEYDSENEIPPYPTYKSIDRIRNYMANGQNLEWIIFEPTKVKKENGEVDEFVRVVDDEWDYVFKKNGDNYVYIEEKSFEHPFGKCPGLINSEITRLGEMKRFSLIDNIIPIEEEYLRDKSILTIFKFQQGFSTPIRPVVVCRSCHGTGKKGTGDCSDCDGKGHVLRKDVTDEIQIPITLDKEAAYNFPPGLFTYMSPDLDIWDQYRKELQLLENLASDTLWGTHKERFENERTAFETFIDTQPVTIKLAEISEVAEFMEWQLTEWIANFVKPDKPKDESVSIISYGKTFIIEPSEAIMERYRTNKEAGVSAVVLDRQLFEYLTSKYKNNPQVLRMELIKKELDYYVHFNVDEVQETFNKTEAQKKMIFIDWWETLDFEKVRTTDIETLKKERDEWVKNELELLNVNTENNLETNTKENGEN